MCFFWSSTCFVKILDHYIFWVLWLNLFYMTSDSCKIFLVVYFSLNVFLTVLLSWNELVCGNICQLTDVLFIAHGKAFFSFRKQVMSLHSLDILLIHKNYENSTDPRLLNLWLMKIKIMESIEHLQTKFLLPYLSPFSFFYFIPSSPVPLHLFSSPLLSPTSARYWVQGLTHAKDTTTGLYF